MRKPWNKLSEEHRKILLEGTGGKKIRFTYTNQYRHKRWYEASFEGILANLQRRHAETEPHRPEQK